MINLYLWFGLFITALLGCFLLKHERSIGELVMASLLGIMVRVLQIIVLGLFFVFTPEFTLPRWIMGFGISALMVLGFLSLAFLIHSKGNKRLVSTGLYFFMGYFVTGFIIAYFIPSFLH